MSSRVAWMPIITLVVAAHKLLPPRAAIDVPLALAIVALGLIIFAPQSLV